MTFKKFALTLALGLGCAGMAAVSASGSDTPPAVPGNEGKSTPVATPKADALPHRNGQSETCRNATWPYIPAECLKNFDPQRPARTVRIIPIYKTPS